MDIDEALICADDEWESTSVERTLAAEVRRLREENERLRKDAERWRWWRNAPQSEVLRLSHYAFDALDTAVDKARSTT